VTTCHRPRRRNSRRTLRTAQPDPETPAPFLKWAGGKGRLVPQLRGHMPSTLAGRGYVEPFMGSAAMFFHVRRHLDPARCTLLDANPELVNLFIHVRDHLEQLVPLLRAHQDRHNAAGISPEARADYYYAVRSAVVEPASVASAARFLYLNKTCYNGLHRVNRRGEFNVPIGSYTRPTICDAAGLARASRALQGVTLAVCSFRDCEAHIQAGDFVYLDPPYEPLSASSNFNAYAADGFTREDQQALRDLLAGLRDRAAWMLSNSTAPFIEDLYARPGMYRRHVHATRMINSVGSRRGAVPELVVTNYPSP